MTVADYFTLIKEVTEELNRRDLDDKIPLFIQLAESEMRRDLEVGTGQEINQAYQQPITSLGPANLTNWLITDHPDVYFYATLKHSAPYLKEDERIALWAGLYGQIKSSINSDARKYSIDAEPQLRHSHSTCEGFR